MIGEIFKSGNLEMSSVPVDAAVIPAWGDFPANRILVGVSVALFLLNLPGLVRLLPLLLDCYTRTRANNNLEHNLSHARERTGCALALTIPFCLAADRFCLYRPSFWQHIPDAWSAPATLGILLAFILVRLLFFCIFKPKGGQEQTDTVHNTGSNYFILLSVLVLLSAGILPLFHVEAEVTGKLILWETALVYLLSFIRTGQILNQFCNGFSTFLYLCALEAAPVSILVASAVFL